MRALPRLLMTLAAAGTLLAVAPAPAEADGWKPRHHRHWDRGGPPPWAGRGGYWYDPPPRWVPAPRHYAPPPRVWYPPPPRYYAPPPPPALGFHFRF